ncbi:MAG: cyclic nucleotide-binding domain-containing protein, partial [Flammeovirgaceae bacterium]|nr:cyclic nucleotide-binding domain-containing protein [Flammeovirgaceae bacterium]MDW8287197.1 cyclic nucleotide-binding domain-containing protein [Flammeovirgaceae bacterium]
GKNRGFSLKHILEETDISPTRIQLLMGILNDTTKPLMEIEKVLILKSTRMFAETPEHLLADIAQIVREERVPKEKVIFKKGDVADKMYIIYEGEISIKEQSTYVLINGDIFGELDFLDSKLRSADAIALRDSLLLRIDQEDFYELMATRKEVVRGIIRFLCERIRTQAQNIYESAPETKTKDKNLNGKVKNNLKPN